MTDESTTNIIFSGMIILIIILVVKEPFRDYFQSQGCSSCGGKKVNFTPVNTNESFEGFNDDDFTGWKSALVSNGIEEFDDERQCPIEEPNNRNHDTYISDIGVGPKTKKSQMEWAKEAIPLIKQVRPSRSALEVENYLPFMGLFRPLPVKQSKNPLQITEVGYNDLSRNKQYQLK